LRFSESMLWFIYLSPSNLFLFLITLRRLILRAQPKGSTFARLVF
jgi:hypothetical protein